MQADIIKALIENRLHEVFTPSTFNLPDQVVAGDRPSIYCLALCDQFGKTPSKRQLLRAIEYMEAYCQLPADSGPESEAAVCDFRLDIDSVQSGDPSRVWVTKGRLAAQRQAPNEEQRTAVAVFCRVTRARLELIPDEDLENPITWSVTYVGWSSTPERREKEHKRHNLNDSYVKRY